MTIFKKLLVCFLFALLPSLTFSQVKISPNLKKNFRAEAGKTLVTLNVKDMDAFRKKYLGKVFIHQSSTVSRIISVTTLHKDLLKELQEDSNILFIDRHEPVREEAILEHTNPNFNRITKAHYAFPTITGSNLKISIKEQRFDSTDIDLKNRSFATTTTPALTSQHATSMATLIAGGGNSSWQSAGVVPQAQITSADYNNISPDDISIFTANNIHLQNHSYGVGLENYYGSEAVAYDQQVSQNPTLLHVFSSGNSGKLMPSSGSYQNMLFANITGTFKQAKNVLVVNAVDTTLLINALNSRGPAYDGRLKPELTAFGSGGTSEACALASGVSAMVQEKYLASNGQLPEAPMVKAILIASADDIGPKGIDFLYGYGSINAYQALQLIELNQFSTVTLSSNDLKTVPINIPASVAEIKIAVAWNDPAASLMANSALVNDIDSWLDDGSTTTLPWVLSSYPKSDSLTALPKRKIDTLNNVEYITLTNPPQGSYQLNLKSGSLAGTSQAVSVAYWMSMQNQFSWDFPDAGQIVQGGGKSLLVWQAAADQTGDLYLRLNQGSWQLIKSGIDLNQYFYWSSPNVLAKANLKIVIGANEFISDEFMISPQLKMTTAFNCTDSLGLVWNSSKQSTGYEIYTMGTQYLKKISTVTDTMKVLSTSSRLYFSVAPVLNGVTGLRSEAIDYTKQGAFCYLNLFAAERTSSTQVKVQLSIGSWHDVDHVVIFKYVKGVQSTFQTISPSYLLSYSYYDTDLIPGVMSYSAVIFFKNGLTTLSDVISVPIEEKGKALLYPNPVSSESDLNIISAGGGLKFRILDLYGQTIFEKELQLFQDAIDVVSLPAGLYIYQLLSGGQVNDTGRFIKY